MLTQMHYIKNVKGGTDRFSVHTRERLVHKELVHDGMKVFF